MVLFEQFWEAITIESLLKFFVIYFFVVWIALVLWVARDISFRTHSRILQIICVLSIVLFTPFGIFLYLLMRPRRNVYEKAHAEINENLSILWEIVEEQIDQKARNTLYCAHCDGIIQINYMACPHCETQIKQRCLGCEKEVRSSWKICPYCKEDIIPIKKKKLRKSQKQKKKK